MPKSSIARRTPSGADRLELAEDLGIAAQDAALAELELQQRGVDARLLQDLAHHLGEVAAHELAERDVDRDAASAEGPGRARRGPGPQAVRSTQLPIDT